MSVVSSQTTILFDLDKTLLALPVDIEGARDELHHFFAQRGILRTFRPILVTIREAARAASDDLREQVFLEQNAMAILARYDLEASKHATPCSKARSVISELHSRHITLGIVTNNGRACVIPALTAAGISPDSFKVIIGREDVSNPKPAPEGLLHAVRAVGLTNVLWYVGDQQTDVRAGMLARDTYPQLRIAWLRAAGAAESIPHELQWDCQLERLTGVLDLLGVRPPGPCSD